MTDDSATAETKAVARREKLIAQFEDPGVRRAWKRRSRRRGLVVRYLLLSAVATAALTVMVVAEAGWTVTFSALAMVLLLLPVSAMKHRLDAGARLKTGFEEVVDERQRVEIERARVLGHTVTGVMLTGFAVLAGVAHLLFDTVLALRPEVSVGLFAPLSWVVLVAHTSLPSCYLAWTQPDENIDDEDELAVAAGHQRSGPAQP